MENPTLTMLRMLKCAVGWLGDEITERTGWAAVRVPLARASERRQVTLDVPGYLQTNSYGCGAVAAAMIVRYLHPRMAFGTVYDAIGPDPDLGASSTRVKRGLQACGVEVTFRCKFTFRHLCDAIDDGTPVAVSIHNPGATSRHWVVVYGYGKRPDRIFLAGNNLPFIASNKVTRKQFERFWNPKGNGLICRKAKSRPVARRSKSSLHK